MNNRAIFSYPNFVIFCRSHAILESKVGNGYLELIGVLYLPVVYVTHLKY